MIKKILVLVLFAVLGFMLNRFIKNALANSQSLSNDLYKPGSQVQKMVGGDRDEHGCIGSAGYTWCESKGKCLRLWEEDCR
jgi:hypothetical protein